jgi:hypothetical protein
MQVVISLGKEAQPPISQKAKPTILAKVQSHTLPVPPVSYSPPSLPRGNQLGVADWAALADALEPVRSLVSLNGCSQYAAIRAGGLREMNLCGTELGVWAARFLERSASTLTTLDIR